MKTNRRPRRPSGTTGSSSGKEDKGSFSPRGKRPASGRGQGFRKDEGPGRGRSGERSGGGRPWSKPGGFDKRSSGDRPERGGSRFGDKRSSGDRPERGGSRFGDKRSSGDRPERGGSRFGDKRSSGDRPERGAPKFGGPGKGDERKEYRKSRSANYGKPYKPKYKSAEGGERRSGPGSFERGGDSYPRRKSTGFGDRGEGSRRPGAGGFAGKRSDKGGFAKRGERGGEGVPRKRPAPFGDKEEGSKRPPSRGFAGKGRDKGDLPTKSERPAGKRSFVQAKVEQQQQQSRPQDKESEATAVVGDGLIRLNKFIANSGVCSRREADELIKMGLITVNGTSITEMGFKVKATDDVRHDGKRLSAEKPVYILMNKPKGFITTTDDPQERNTVMHIIAGAVKERVYPVGRLDRNTTGLLLITNDGDVADKLTHPSYNAKKIYKVDLDRPITKNDLQAIQEGVQLEEGRAIVDDLAVVSDDKKTVGLEIHIGWNRVVRRIFEALNYQVMKLDRVVYAGMDKKDLKRGQWRFLTQEEIVRLKHFK